MKLQKCEPISFEIRIDKEKTVSEEQICFGEYERDQSRLLVVVGIDDFGMGGAQGLNGERRRQKLHLKHSFENSLLK